MKTFATYFTFPKILFALCAKRLALLDKRHDHIFLDNIKHVGIKPHKISDSEKILTEIFPARKTWIRLSKNRRMKESDSSQETVFRELWITVMKERAVAQKTGFVPDWLKNLEQFVLQIRTSMGNPSSLTDIKPVGKAFIPKNKATKEHRVIAQYSLSDNIITSLVTEYLTDHTDTAAGKPFFSNSSYAFRSTRLKSADHEFTYHSATKNIEEFRVKNIDGGIYVAEVDLEKFFDTVNHNVLLNCFDELLKHFESIGLPIDNRAVQIAKNYLNSFCFNRDVQPDEQAGVREFNWPAQKLALLGVELSKERIGVAQGGALSCFFANLIMHELDRIFPQDEPNMKYLRYCDDFIILHTDKNQCKFYTDLALQKIRELKLVAHSPDDYTLVDYKKIVQKKNGTRLVNEFWNSSKSKNPYKWGAYDKNNTTNVPYVSFVGYQRRYDGFLRVRKKSLKKEYGKQKELVNDVIRRIKAKPTKPVKINRKRIQFRTEQKLIAMSVGKMNKYNLEKRLGFCWCSGFKQMMFNQTKSNSQLKYLDRSREQQLRRLKREMAASKFPQEQPLEPKKVAVLNKPLTSYYSYFNQSKHKTK